MKLQFWNRFRQTTMATDGEWGILHQNTSQLKAIAVDRINE